FGMGVSAYARTKDYTAKNPGRAHSEAVCEDVAGAESKQRDCSSLQATVNCGKRPIISPTVNHFTCRVHTSFGSRLWWALAAAGTAKLRIRLLRACKSFGVFESAWVDRARGPDCGHVTHMENGRLTLFCAAARTSARMTVFTGSGGMDQEKPHAWGLADLETVGLIVDLGSSLRTVRVAVCGSDRPRGEKRHDATEVKRELILQLRDYRMASLVVVRTKNGPVEGIVHRKNLMAAQPRPRDVAAFYGIPFAAPPVGNLRFRPPQPLNETWSVPRLMNETGFSCADREDCLYLDLFAPNDAINSNASLPVFLWVHGGGFAFGVPENGTALASVHNIIVVSIRYRLGHFGFFASPASLSQEGTTGNWGTLDQQFAMKWIQANIAAFGGDHDKVTLAGQSAGAFSVMWHL
ncbi:hypothetical protein FOL47_001232, partial [Perkinsus chesapeaki]